MLRTGWISGAMRCHELGCGTRVPSWLLRPAAEEAAAARSCCFRLMVSKASRACEETEAAGVWVAGVDGGSGWREWVAEVGGGSRLRRASAWRRQAYDLAAALCALWAWRVRLSLWAHLVECDLRVRMGGCTWVYQLHQLVVALPQ